jgi:glutamate--cysteine ligase catalytic subunit
MKSIRERRGEKVKILVPLFKDEKYLNGITSVSSFENKAEEEMKSDQRISSEKYPGFIYMDSMHFGMGCSCLQVTFES